MDSFADRRAWVVVGALAAIAFTASLVLQSQLFPHLSSNNDEPIYLLQAQTMRNGHLTLSAATHDDFFRPWMSGEHEGHLFLVVQPVLPALLAASDLAFGSTRVALGLIAAAAVVGVFLALREVLEDARVAVIAAAVFTLSPLVIAQSALYLTYVLAVALTAYVIAFVGRGVRLDDRRWWAGAGLVYGLLLFTRPIEGIMLALALAIWLMARGGWRPLARVAITMLVGTLPVVAVMLLYNKGTTGNPLRFPLWAIGGNDSFGFGDRSIVTGAPVVHYGLSEAWLTLRTNLRSFPHWLLGGLVTVPLLAWGAVQLWKTKRHAFVLLAAITVIYPLGYFFYWGNYLIIAGRNLFGPHYYLALLLPATALIAVALHDLVRRRSALAFVLVPLLIAGTAIEVRDKIDANQRYDDGVEGEALAIDHSVGDARAIVLVPAGPDGAWVLHPRGAFGNDPDLHNTRLFAADLTGRNNELFDRFPDRGIYRLQVLDTGHGRRPDVRRLERRRVVDSAIELAIHDPAAVAYASVAGATERCTPTGATVHVQLAPRTVTLTNCREGDRQVPLPLVPSTVAIGATAGDTDIEQRFWVRPSGATLDVITPADTWRRDPQHEFVVIDPATVSFVGFTVQP